MEKEIDVLYSSSENKEVLKRIQRKQRLEQLKIEKEKQLRRRESFSKIKHVVAYTSLAALITAGGFSLYKEIQFQNKPVTIVSNDMMSNVKLNFAGDGIIDPKLFDENKTMEMYEYIKQNNISNDEIYETIEKLCKRVGVDYEFAVGKLNELYPSIFEKEIEQSHKL